MNEQLLFGLDRLLHQPGPYQGKRIALVCTHASVTVGGIASREALLKNGFNLVKLFSPEHGLDAVGEDGHYQADGTDKLTGLPVTSLYGDRLAPQAEDLAGIDLVLVDLPDVGCRFYTYLWTMSHVMEACARFNIPILVTDRPNPTGGNLQHAEGPMLDEVNCSSFIGRWRIPVRHSCTLGELALYFKAIKMPHLDLSVIPVLNWQRHQRNSFNFTATSPAIRNFDTALLYPGTGLLEGINVNEGRGTDFPFKVCGAPWINKQSLYELVSKNPPAGLAIHPASYIPESGLYKGKQCHGVDLNVTDETTFRPVQTGIKLIRAMLTLYPNECHERLYDTHANPGGMAHLDKLLGIPDVLHKIKDGEEIETGVAEEWIITMEEHLLYK